MELEFRKAGLSLVPVGDDAHEALRKCKEGQIFIIPLVRNRNPQFHRLAMAMLRKMHDMTDWDVEFEPWRKYLLIQAGYCITTGFPNGAVTVDALSLSYKSMSQEKFEEVFQALHRTYGKIYGEKMTYDQLVEWSLMP